MRGPGPNAIRALGARWRARVLVLALSIAAVSPAAAAAQAGHAETESNSFALIAGAGLIAFLALAGAALGILVLMRRMRHAASEARRLSALLDVLDEGVAVCSGMHAVAVNSSLCRLIGIAPIDAQHLM